MPLGSARPTPAIATSSRPSLRTLPGSPAIAEQRSRLRSAEKPDSARWSSANEKAILHAKSIAAPREDRRIASAWRRVRLVQHESERTVLLGPARHRGRLPSQDRGDRSAAGKSRKDEACLRGRRLPEQD